MTHEDPAHPRAGKAGPAAAPDAPDAAQRAIIARLASEVVPMLIERLTKSELGELEVREQGWRIRLRRPEANGSAPGVPGAGGAVPQPAADRAGQGAHHEARPPQREAQRNAITSPAVGYFLPRDGVQAGQDVRGGDMIGHVDVLGVRVEVVAETDGKLTRVDVEPGQAVEYGQPIAHLEPASVSRPADV